MSLTGSAEWTSIENNAFREFVVKNGTLLEGEGVIDVIDADLSYPSKIIGGQLFVTNYKLVYLFKDEEDNWISEDKYNATLFSIWNINITYSTESTILEISAKDLKKLTFAVNALAWSESFITFIKNKAFWNNADTITKIREHVFAFSHKYPIQPLLDHFGFYEPDVEFNRLELSKFNFTIETINKDYSLCGSYPKKLFVPKSVSHHVLRQSALYRGNQRFPVVSWVHQNGATLSRSAQPLVGLRGQICAADEELVNHLSTQNKQAMRISADTYQSHPIKHLVDKSPLGYNTTESVDDSHVKMYFVDARSKNMALLNCGKGGGYENTSRYSNSFLHFLNIPNIHNIRSSYLQLTNNSQSCAWISHIKTMMDGAIFIAHIISQKCKSVLCHCTDGWDRTSQLVSLVQIMLDSYFRTIKGFGILLQKEWIQFGHKFSTRLGHGTEEGGNYEQSPIFLQFLDSVHQMMIQFPEAFEFNETYLLTIVDEVYSGRFGTFLMNCEKERDNIGLYKSAPSIWPWILEPHNKKRFTNPKYELLNMGIVVPDTNLKSLKVWTGYFNRYKNESIITEDVNLDNIDLSPDYESEKELFDDDIPDTDNANSLCVPQQTSDPLPISVKAKDVTNSFFIIDDDDYNPNKSPFTDNSPSSGFLMMECKSSPVSVPGPQNRRYWPFT